jgi:hypothetical protein
MKKRGRKLVLSRETVHLLDDVHGALTGPCTTDPCSASCVQCVTDYCPVFTIETGCGNNCRIWV